MLFFGHITAGLRSDATDTGRSAAIAGNLTPDVIDKTGAWIVCKQPARWRMLGPRDDAGNAD